MKRLSHIFLLAGPFAAALSVTGCSGSGASDNPVTTTNNGASSTGSSGGAGGSSTASGGGGNAGASGGGGDAGASGAGGTSVGSTGGAGATGDAGGDATGSSTVGGGGANTSGSGGSGGTGGSPDAGTAGGFSPPDGGPDGGTDSDITKIAPTMGCGTNLGQAVGMAVRGTIPTMGTKPNNCADSKCGAWAYEREYFVTLPQGYDNTKAYPMVFLGPGCGTIGENVYTLDNNVANTVIRVGLTPPPSAIGRPAPLVTGCFDDREGDDSVDWVFYESLYDRLATQLCFDKNRVFAGGNSTGAWLANELGCKYAGDAARPIRGVLANNGGLSPLTCSNKPMAGMWIFGVNSSTPEEATFTMPITRAMSVNGCQVGTTYDNAEFDPFPVASNSGACKKIKGCPDLYPLVVCSFGAFALSPNDLLANPGFATFLKLFSAPPLFTQ